MKRVLLILFASICACIVQAQTVPGTLSYQGILLQNDGITPLPDGPQTIVFNFYDVPTGGTAQLTRTLTVTTLKGLYTCILGDGTSGNAALPATVGNQQMYIGIAVNGGTELLPRAQLTTTPYAWMAQSAYSIADNTISTAKIVDAAVTNAKLADVADANLVLNIVGTGKIQTNSLTGTGERLVTANSVGQLLDNYQIRSGLYDPTLTAVLAISSFSASNLRYLIIGNVFYVSGIMNVDASTSGSGAFAISVPPGVGTMVGVDGTFANWEANAQGDVRLGTSNRIEFRWVLNSATGFTRAYHFICMGHF